VSPPQQIPEQGEKDILLFSFLRQRTLCSDFHGSNFFHNIPSRLKYDRDLYPSYSIFIFLLDSQLYYHFVLPERT
ncbi:MAG: hypothetical protein LBJ14_07100, partial [Desulfarculales bacterium]|nr:hypothetical protein [Desulfarculales bacterium]